MQLTLKLYEKYKSVLAIHPVAKSATPLRSHKSSTLNEPACFSFWRANVTSSLSIWWLCSVPVSSADNNKVSLSTALQLYSVVSKNKHTVGLQCCATCTCSYLHTEWWCYRGCRSWPRGRRRCLEHRNRMQWILGLGWTSPAYMGNTLMCTPLLGEGNERMRREIFVY